MNFFSKRIKAFRHAFHGLFLFFAEGIHAQLMLLAAVLSLLLGWWLQISTPEWLTIILCCGLVLALEAINSAIEYLTDLVSPKHHILAKKTKDVAAAAVLIISFTSAVIGCIIFIPKL